MSSLNATLLVRMIRFGHHTCASINNYHLIYDRPIPNIFCAEIFPTRVRGICIAICALTFWIGDIIVTYSLPVMLNAIGLGGVFGIYAIVCCLAFVFVIFRIPETKGLPLEVIIEFFNVGSKGLQNEVE